MALLLTLRISKYLVWIVVILQIRSDARGVELVILLTARRGRLGYQVKDILLLYCAMLSSLCVLLLLGVDPFCDNLALCFLIDSGLTFNNLYRLIESLLAYELAYCLHL